MINKPWLQESANAFRITIDDEAAEKLDCFAQLLVEQNQKFNLTSILNPKDMAIKHFLDSLFILSAAELAQGGTLIDVGAGAGFPSIPLAIVRKDLKIVQIDGSKKKVDFLNQIAGTLGLKAKAYHARAEELAHDLRYREKFQYTTARAVAPLPALCEYCLGFVEVGGSFLAMKGKQAENELTQGKNAITTLGGVFEKTTKLLLPDAGERQIIEIKKHKPTPARFPRMQGKIKKHPL